MTPRVLFVSPRETLLRVVMLVCFLPVPLVAWLLSLGTRATWEKEAGLLPWWVLVAGLIAVSLVMPAAMLWLHDRYVLRLEREGEAVRVTTFLLWGRREHRLSLEEISRAAERMAGQGVTGGGVGPVVNAPSWQLRLPNGRRLIFDLQGDVPEGWSELYGLTRRK